MNSNDLKIGQRLFFISAEYNIPEEEVYITKINEDNTFFIMRNKKNVLFEISNEDGSFYLAMSDEINESENYGFLYLNHDLIEQERRYYKIVFDNINQIDNLVISEKIKLTNFLENLLKENNL